MSNYCFKVNMHLLLHPSAWSDRADDEAENDILAMQVPICKTAITLIGKMYFLSRILIFLTFLFTFLPKMFESNVWYQEASSGVHGAEFRPPPGNNYIFCILQCNALALNSVTHVAHCSVIHFCVTLCCHPTKLAKHLAWLCLSRNGCLLNIGSINANSFPSMGFCTN